MGRKIDFTSQFYDMQGNPLGDGPKKKLMLGSIAVNALTMNFPDEVNLSGEDKIKRFMLAMDIVKATDGTALTDLGVLDLDDPKIQTIRSLIGKAYGTLLVGQAWDILDGKANPLQPKQAQSNAAPPPPEVLVPTPPAVATDPPTIN